MKLRLAILTGTMAVVAMVSSCSSHNAVTSGTSSTLPSAVTIPIDAADASTVSADNPTVLPVVTAPSSTAAKSKPASATATVAVVTTAPARASAATSPKTVVKTVHETATVTATARNTAPANPNIVVTTEAIPTTVDHPAPVAWCVRSGIDPQLGTYNVVVHNGQAVINMTELQDSMITFWKPNSSGLLMRTNISGGNITGGSKTDNGQPTGNRADYKPFEWVQALQPGDTTLVQWKEIWPHAVAGSNGYVKFANSFQSLEPQVSQADQQAALDLYNQFQVYYGHVNDDLCD